MNPIQITTRQCHYNRAANALGVLRSTLPSWKPGAPVVVTSHKTGAIATFELSEEVLDGHRLTGWRYKPNKATLRSVPACAGIRLGIKNDV